jgi:phage host-nuclease inhibitor protein Gam
MAARRRKAEKLPAVQTLDEAVRLLGRFAVLDAEIAARKARTEQAIASLRAQTAELNAPAEAEIKSLFLQLKPWWAVAADEVTGGKRKSWELGGCLIGHRIGNPALVHPQPEAFAIEIIEALGIADLVRVKKELDKQALIRALSADEAALDQNDRSIIVDLKMHGFSIKQTETFFIDRLPPKDTAVETITDPQAEQVPA